MTTVYFFGANKPFGFLSNWAYSPFEYESVEFTDMEQYIMYCKADLFGDDEMCEKILKSPNPKTSKALGRKVRGYDDKRWNEELHDIIYWAF